MNDLMSFGLHRCWKKKAVSYLDVNGSHHILDLAGGTGDLSRLISKKLNLGQITLADISESMLRMGRDQMINAGVVNIDYALCNAEKMPFRNEVFDRSIMAFGLRNVVDQSAALKELSRVLKRSGKLVILEFSRPTNRLVKKLYDLYSFSVLPKLGQWVANDSKSYQYLAESIRMHPNQKRMQTLMEENGFEKVSYIDILTGIVAIHVGIKPNK